MLGMAMDSAKLFFAGKLFQNSKVVMAKLAVGAGLGALALVGAGQLLPIWIAALIGGAVSGAAQPLLFKDLKYA